MNKNWCGTVVETYLQFLSSEFTIVPREDECLIVTPALRPDNEYIELVIKPENGNVFRVTDECRTLDYLYLNGLNLERNTKLYNYAAKLADQRGVRLSSSELFAVAESRMLGAAIHALLDATQAITYLIYRRSHRSRPTFKDEVEVYLISHEVIYHPGSIVQGKANVHKVSFHINSRRNLLVEPLTASTLSSARQKAKLWAYQCLDIRAVAPHYRHAAVIDDSKDKWETLWSDDEVRKPLKDYSDYIIRWSNKTQLIDLALGNRD